MMNESVDASRMARDNFGYGNWDAPYWFIGPEQGQARGEEPTKRLSAWYEMGCLDLNDCQQYHRSIGESSWHGERAKLQPTWRKLTLTLLEFSKRSTDDVTRRKYQTDQWGTLSGESLVVELSGFAAPSLKDKSKSESQLDTASRVQRIAAILKPIKDGSKNPKFVVLYGTSSASCKQMWEAISKVSVSLDEKPNSSPSYRRKGGTIFAFVSHPTAMKSTNDSWIELGRNLRIHSDRLLG